jgi:formyl-CoA transferase
LFAKIRWVFARPRPEADKPGFDITAYWARSGLMEFTRDAGSPPTIPIPGIGDHATAISLYAGIVTGLYRRERTGKGCNVTASLIAEGAWATAAWLQPALWDAKFSHPDRKNPQNPLAGGTYQTSDGRWVLLAFVETDKNWPVFAKAIDRADLAADARFGDSKSRAANPPRLSPNSTARSALNRSRIGKRRSTPHGSPMAWLRSRKKS